MRGSGCRGTRGRGAVAADVMDVRVVPGGAKPRLCPRRGLTWLCGDHRAAQHVGAGRNPTRGRPGGASCSGGVSHTAGRCVRTRRQAPHPCGERHAASVVPRAAHGQWRADSWARAPPADCPESADLPAGGWLRWCCARCTAPVPVAGLCV